MLKVLAAWSLLAALAAAQEGEKAESPYRLDFDRVAIEKHADETRISLRATSNLPRGTPLDFSFWLLVDHYDRTKKTIVRQPLDPPVLRKIRGESVNGGRVEFTTVESFPREGEVRIEASFRPDRLFDPEREPIRRSMKEWFVPMKWEKSQVLGTPSSRLTAVASGFPVMSARIAEVEKLVKRLDQLMGAREEAVAEVCGEVNALRTKMEQAMAESPYPAGVGYLWDVLGDVASWGAYKAILAAAAKKGKGADVADPDGVQKKPPPKDAPSFEKFSAEAFMNSLSRAREIVVREYALAGAGELRRVHDEAVKAAQGAGLGEKSLKGAVEAARNAVQKHHHAGRSKLGEPYTHLFAASAEEAFEAALKRLDIIGDSDAAESEKSSKELGALMAAWRGFEK